MKDKPVREKKNLDKGLKRSAGKPACCVSKGGRSSNTTSLPDQVVKTTGFEKRAQYYAAKAYSSQAHKGDQYQDLKGVIFIAIADFILFPNKLAYKSDHVTFDKITYEHDLKDFSFTFIELPKFNKTKEDQLSNIVEKWIYFFKYADETSEEDLQKIIGSDVIIGRAYDVLNQYNWSKEERFAYDQTKKHIDDYLSSIQQGKIEGKIEGIKIGEEKGRKEGREEGKIEVAKTMLANNIDVTLLLSVLACPLVRLKNCRIKCERLRFLFSTMLYRKKSGFQFA